MVSFLPRSKAPGSQPSPNATSVSAVLHRHQEGQPPPSPLQQWMGTPEGTPDAAPARGVRSSSPRGIPWRGWGGKRPVDRVLTCGWRVEDGGTWRVFASKWSAAGMFGTDPLGRNWTLGPWHQHVQRPPSPPNPPPCRRCVSNTPFVAGHAVRCPPTQRNGSWRHELVWSARKNQ